jgi:hypothetical protein
VIGRRRRLLLVYSYRSIKMASISSTNVNGKLSKDQVSFLIKNNLFILVEFLPGLEDFLRSMSTSTHLDSDHRHIAAMYLDKLDQLSQLTNQQSSSIDDPSL